MEHTIEQPAEFDQGDFNIKISQYTLVITCPGVFYTSSINLVSFHDNELSITLDLHTAKLSFTFPSDLYNDVKNWINRMNYLNLEENTPTLI